MNILSKISCRAFEGKQAILKESASFAIQLYERAGPLDHVLGPYTG